MSSLFFALSLSSHLFTNTDPSLLSGLSVPLPLPLICLMWFPFSPSISLITLCPSPSASITIFFIIYLSIFSASLSEFSGGVVDQSDSLLGPRWPGPGRLLQLPAQSLWPGGGAAEVSTHKQKSYVAAVKTQISPKRFRNWEKHRFPGWPGSFVNYVLGFICFLMPPFLSSGSPSLSLSVSHFSLYLFLYHSSLGTPSKSCTKGTAGCFYISARTLLHLLHFSL